MKYYTALTIILGSLLLYSICDANSFVIRGQMPNQNDAVQLENNQLIEIKNLRNKVLLQRLIEDIYDETLDELLPEILQSRKQNGIKTSLLVI
jgi:hypothetical protein